MDAPAGSAPAPHAWRYETSWSAISVGTVASRSAGYGNTLGKHADGRRHRPDAADGRAGRRTIFAAHLRTLRNAGVSARAPARLCHRPRPARRACAGPIRAAGPGTSRVPDAGRLLLPDRHARRRAIGFLESGEGL